MPEYRNEAGGVVGAIPYEVASYWLLYFIKHKNDMHAPACSTPEANFI